MNRNLLSASLALALACAMCFASEPAYDFKTVDFPGSNNTQISSINNRGEISGLYFDSGGVGRAFYSVNGVLNTVPGLGDIFSQAGRRNERGMLVGDYVNPTDNKDHTFLFRNGVLTTLDNPPGGTAAVLDINEPGDMMSGTFTDSSSVTHGVIRSRFNWIPFDYPNAPNVRCTFATGLNDRGVVVGLFSTPTAPFLPTLCPVATPSGMPFQGRDHGFIELPDETFFLLDPPNSIQTMPFDINNSGVIVGGYADSNTTHGFMLTDVTLAHGKAEGKFSTIDFPGASLTFVLGINDKGDIAGAYKNPPGTPDCPATSLFCGAFHGFVATRAGHEPH